MSAASWTGSMSFIKTLMLTVYYQLYTLEHKKRRTIELPEIWRTAHNYSDSKWNSLPLVTGLDSTLVIVLPVEVITLSSSDFLPLVESTEQSPCFKENLQVQQYNHWCPEIVEKWEEKSHKVPTQRWESRNLLDPIAGSLPIPSVTAKTPGAQLVSKYKEIVLQSQYQRGKWTLFNLYLLYICFNAKIRCWFCRRSPFVSLSLHVVHKTTVKREKNMQAEAVSETATFIVISRDANQRRDFKKLLICSITADKCHLFHSQESISCLKVCQRVPEWHYNLHQEQISRLHYGRFLYCSMICACR